MLGKLGKILMSVGLIGAITSILVICFSIDIKLGLLIGFLFLLLAGALIVISFED